MHQHLVFTLLLLATSISAAYAVPSKREWQTLLQPDSTTIEVKLIGDEHYHYYQNRQGQKVRQNDAGYWVVITNAEFDQNRQAKHTSISLKAPRKMHVGESFTPTVHTNSSGSVSIYTSDEGIVSVDPMLGTITALREGQVQVIVEVSPTRDHYSATRILLIRVLP